MAFLVKEAPRQSGSGSDSVVVAAHSRLLALAAERERLTRRLALIDELEKELRALFQSQKILLDDEAAGSDPGTALKAHVSNHAIRTFLTEKLKYSSPQSKAQLAGALIKRGFDLRGRSVARVVHMNLVTLMNLGTIEPDSTGVYWSIKRLKEMPP